MDDTTVTMNLLFIIIVKGYMGSYPNTISEVLIAWVDFQSTSGRVPRPIWQHSLTKLDNLTGN